MRASLEVRRGSEELLGIRGFCKTSCSTNWQKGKEQGKKTFENGNPAAVRLEQQGVPGDGSKTRTLSAFCKSKLTLSQASSYRTAITLYAELWVQGMASDEQPEGEDCASTQCMYILEVMVHEEAEVTDIKSGEPTGHDKDCPCLRTQEDPIMAAGRGWSVRASGGSYW